MNVFFTSDLHIGHVNIMKYGRGDHFDSLDHMREMMIANYNAVVEPDDLVYILGDVVMGKRMETLPHLGRLNGKKVLVLGNHDYPHPCNPEKVRNKFTDEYRQHFVSIAISLPHTLSDGAKVLLHHFPETLDHTDEVRYAEYRPTVEDYQDRFLLHGHLHCEDISVAPRHIHVGVDADWTSYGVPRYSPIPESAVLEAIRDRS